MKGPEFKETMDRLEDLESFGENTSCLMGEEHFSDRICHKLTSFNNFVGMLVVGFEKEIISF